MNHVPITIRKLFYDRIKGLDRCSAQAEKMGSASADLLSSTMFLMFPTLADHICSEFAKLFEAFWSFRNTVKPRSVNFVHQTVDTLSERLRFSGTKRSPSLWKEKKKVRRNGFSQCSACFQPVSAEHLKNGKILCQPGLPSLSLVFCAGLIFDLLLHTCQPRTALALLRNSEKRYGGFSLWYEENLLFVTILYRMDYRCESQGTWREGHIPEQGSAS